MGWTYVHKDRSISASDFLKNEFTWSNDKASVKVLDVAIVGLRTAYMAVERKGVNTKGQPIDEVIAIICLLDYRKDDYYNFGYKDMDESMHPYYYDCPKRILDMLTPTDNELARTWREECRKRLAQASSKPKLKTGHYIVFDRPISFNNGDTLDAFYIQDARRRIFTHGYRRYKISKHAFDSRNYEVLTPEEFAARKQQGIDNTTE